MDEFKYMLCFKEITKAYERFLVTSNKKTALDVHFALANLDFAVYTLFPSTFVAIVLLPLSVFPLSGGGGGGLRVQSEAKF